MYAGRLEKVARLQAEREREPVRDLKLEVRCRRNGDNDLNPLLFLEIDFSKGAYRAERKKQYRRSECQAISLEMRCFEPAAANC